MKKYYLLLLVLLAIPFASATLTLNSATVSPTTAYADSTLTFYCNATDSLSALVDIYYDVYQNGSSIYSAHYYNATSNSSRLLYTKSSGFVEGDTFFVSCIPSNLTNNGTQVNSSVRTISNSAPVVNSVTIAPTSGSAGTSFTCTANVTDVDTADNITKYYTWYYNSVAVGTASTLSTTGYTTGAYLYCAVKGGDGTANTTYTNSASVFLGQAGNTINCNGKDALCNVMESGGAGLGLFMQYMAQAIPTLIIILVIVGIVAVVAFSLGGIVKKAFNME